MTRTRLVQIPKFHSWNYWWPVLLLAGVKLLMHLLTNTNYGFHRDEFLYLDEARHLGWGFLEVPPLTPFLGQIALWMGGSLFAVRLLPAQERAICLIWGGGYHHAGALNYYSKKYGLPEVMSLNSSYRIWVPDTLHFDRMILADDVYSTESSWFRESTLVDSIEHSLARDPGYIYYRHNPRIDVEQAWWKAVAEAKGVFNF